MACWVEENKVGGGSRHWRQRAGKSSERGSKSKGVEVISICCLYGEHHVSQGSDGNRLEVRRGLGGPYLAALHELIISRSANSAARAVSAASCIFCFMSSCVFIICLLTARCVGAMDRTESEAPSPSADLSASLLADKSFITPVASHGVLNGNWRPIGSGCAMASGDFTIDDSASSDAGLLLEAVGVRAGVDVSRRRDPRAWRRVMPPRSFRMASTSWTPSEGLGFFSLMYRSRCRPRDDEVNACPQNGQLLSLEAFGVLASCSAARVGESSILIESLKAQPEAVGRGSKEVTPAGYPDFFLGYKLRRAELKRAFKPTYRGADCSELEHLPMP